MRMSIFVFTLAVALAAGSAYSEMIAMNDSVGPVSDASIASIDQGANAREAAPVSDHQGY